MDQNTVILGPNGAGKTTTLRILVTMLKKDRGLVRVGGFDVNKNPREVRRAVGYMSAAIRHRSAEWWFYFHSAKSVQDAENRGAWKHGGGEGRPHRRFDDTHMRW